MTAINLCQLFPFALLVMVNGWSVITPNMDILYNHFWAMSVVLDPQDYIVDSDSGGAGEYITVNGDMATEITMFYHKEDLPGPEPIRLSFGTTYNRSYFVDFNIFAKNATLVDGEDGINFAKDDEEIMTFYACFLGPMCGNNTVPIKYPLNLMKLSGKGASNMLRVFITGIYFDRKEIQYISPKATAKKGIIAIDPKIGSETVCNFQVKKLLEIKFQHFNKWGTEPNVAMTFNNIKKPKFRFLNLWFAMLFTYVDTNNVKNNRTYLLTAESVEKGKAGANLSVTQDGKWICRSY